VHASQHFHDKGDKSLKLTSQLHPVPRSKLYVHALNAVTVRYFNVSSSYGYLCPFPKQLKKLTDGSVITTDGSSNNLSWSQENICNFGTGLSKCCTSNAVQFQNKYEISVLMEMNM
jgi:hypothetical protein